MLQAEAKGAPAAWSWMPVEPCVVPPHLHACLQTAAGLPTGLRAAAAGRGRVRRQHQLRRTSMLACRLQLGPKAAAPRRQGVAAVGGSVDMEACFSQLTLDVIGKSVFNYDFGALTTSSPVIQARARRRAHPAFMSRCTVLALC